MGPLMEMDLHQLPFLPLSSQGILRDPYQCFLGLCSKRIRNSWWNGSFTHAIYNTQNVLILPLKEFYVLQPT